MENKHNQPSPSNFWAWFNPIGRQTGGWAFILNRITALGLTFYLSLHLIVLGQLAKGPEGYDGFVALMRNPISIFGELLVVAAGIIHGLNGIRIVLTTFGVGVTLQKQLFYGLMAIALIAILVFGFRMFTA
ncbi:MAG: succinate dehydrogenase, cytochrome b556 subunit [Chloroflexi bacterium]|nr:succinate dehydrogenase, cytochrome b556 subunit [Chloroflexota bacterium]